MLWISSNQAETALIIHPIQEKFKSIFRVYIRLPGIRHKQWEDSERTIDQIYASDPL